MVLFVDFRFRRMMDYAYEIGARRKTALVKVKCDDLQNLIIATSDSLGVYHLYTKTFTGKIKSLLPGTRAYAARKQSAEKIEEAYRRLNKMEKELTSYGVVNNKPQEKVFITRSRSAPGSPVEHDDLPKVFPSPLAAKRPQDDIDLHNRQRLADAINTLNALSANKKNQPT